MGSSFHQIGPARLWAELSQVLELNISILWAGQLAAEQSLVSSASSHQPLSILGWPARVQRMPTVAPALISGCQACEPPGHSGPAQIGESPASPPATGQPDAGVRLAGGRNGMSQGDTKLKICEPNRRIEPMHVAGVA